MKSFATRTPANLGALNAVADISGTEPAYSSPDEYYVNITGTFVGTVTFQGSLDGITWFSLKAEEAAAGTVVSSTTAVGAWIIRSFPLFVRAIMSAYTSGAAVVAWSETTSRFI